MKMKKNNTLQEIYQVIQHAQSPVIICHENPDGDTTGSGFGLKHGLELNAADIVCMTPMPRLFVDLGMDAWMLDFPEREIDLYIFVDCSDPQRIGQIAEHIPADAVTINIDHHASNTYFGTYNLVDTQAAATCEIIYQLTQLHGPLTQPAINYIYTGLATDSGLFVHGYTTGRTHRIAAELVDAGAAFEFISKRVFRMVDKKTALLKGRMYGHLQILDDVLAISHISLDDLAAAGADYEDIEGIVHEMTQIMGLKLSVLIKQRLPEQCKISFRSVNGVSARKLAASFGGGGHDQAAGCTIEGDVDIVRNKILQRIEDLAIL